MGRLKRTEAPTFLPIPRKAFVYAPWPKGPKESYTLTVVLRDVLHLAKTAKEARKIVNDGSVSVDGKVKTDPNSTAGLMSAVVVGSSAYRIVPSMKGLSIKEIPTDEASLKLCKITGKKILGGGKIQLNLHDGSNIVSDSGIPTKGTLVMKLPEREISKKLEFKEGMLAVVTKGKNSGKVGKISKIGRIRGMQPNKIYMEVAGKTLEFPEDYIFVIGAEKVEVTI